VALELMREANAPASLSLFWAAGLLWMYKGSLSELAQDAAALLQGGPGSGGAGEPQDRIGQDNCTRTDR